MKIIRNNIIPFPGYKAINLFGILFVRKDAQIDDVTLNHEAIHTAQMKEMLYVFFYLWYLVEWIVRLIKYKNANEAYLNICFEREAYIYEEELDYLETRKPFAFLGFINYTPEE